MRDSEVPEFVSSCERLCEYMRSWSATTQSPQAKVLVEDLIEQIKDTVAQAMSALGRVLPLVLLLSGQLLDVFTMATEVVGIG